MVVAQPFRSVIPVSCDWALHFWKVDDQWAAASQVVESSKTFTDQANFWRTISELRSARRSAEIIFKSEVQSLDSSGYTADSGAYSGNYTSDYPGD